jgi:hypothetical protein
MPAIIESRVNGINPIAGASRDDLRAGDIITLNDVGGPGTTWSWSLVFKPQDANRNPSAAALAGNVLGPGPVTFSVDNEGPYLIRLIKDAGLPTESIQYVRLRYLTLFGDLSLVAAGERRDGTGVIPVDVSAEGWANDQNFNLITLKNYIKRVSTSGRILFVDANRGRNNYNPPNDPAIAEGFADYSTINAAITAATSNAAVNAGLVPSATDPFIIAVRPGVYEEAVNFAPFVHVVGWPTEVESLSSVGDRSVVVRTPSAGVLTHTVSSANPSDFTIIKGLQLENIKTTTNAVVRKVGTGVAVFVDTRIVQNSNQPTDGPCLSVENGVVYADNAYLLNNNTTFDRDALWVNPTPPNTASAFFAESRFSGSSVATLNPNLASNVSVGFLRCSLNQTNVSPLSHGVDSNATTTLFSYSEGFLVNGQPDFVRINPTGVGSAAGGLFAGVYYSRLGSITPSGTRQGVLFNTSGLVGVANFESGSSEYSQVSLVGPNPLVQRAATNSRSLFYDNTLSGLTAENVQDAIDEIAGAVVSPSLDVAYDNGRIITVDADAVELHGPGPINVAPPLNPANGDGTLRVYQQIEVGAIPSSEILVASNNFGNGPSIEMGNLVRNADSNFGSSVYLVANATGAPDYYNYNLRINAADSEGNNLLGSTKMGSIILRCGTALCNSGVNAPDGGDLFMIAGGVEEALGGNPGNLWITPGETGLGVTGFVNIVNPAAATSATLQGANNFVDLAATPAGTLTFATTSGKSQVTFSGGENIATIIALFNDDTGIQATWAGLGNPIVLTSTSTGPDAELIFIDDSTGGTINTYLGDFSITGGATFTPGTYPEFVSLSSNANQTLVVGNGVNDLVYDAVTGKLTVPGLIDPTGMIFDFFPEASVPTGPNKGAIFVSDGSGGATNTGAIYFKDSVGTLYDLTLGGGGGAPATSTFLTINTEGGLPNSRRLLGTTGQITLTPSGGDYIIGMADTAVTAASYTRPNVTIDAKGRITAAASTVVQADITRSMVVPTAPLSPPLPFVVNEYHIQTLQSGFELDGVNNTFNIFVSQAMGLAAGLALVDILVGPPAGLYTSILTAPIDVGVVASGTLITGTAPNFSVGLPYTIAAGQVIYYQITYNAIPATGDGLVVSLVGEI